MIKELIYNIIVYVSFVIAIYSEEQRYNNPEKREVYGKTIPLNSFMLRVLFPWPIKNKKTIFASSAIFYGVLYLSLIIWGAGYIFSIESILWFYMSRWHILVLIFPYIYMMAAIRWTEERMWLGFLLLAGLAAYVLIPIYFILIKPRF